MERWPSPAALAAAAPADVLRAWGRLGYPRRALRLREAAVTITRDHGGVVPDDVACLLELPGVGEYTAAAVACFAYGRAVMVLDTNVRRVLARLVMGRAQATPSIRVAERALAASLVPGAEGDADACCAAHPGRAHGEAAVPMTGGGCGGDLGGPLIDPPQACPSTMSAAAWNLALMELGSLVCTAGAPRCDQCPLGVDCAWLAAGWPEDEWKGSRRRQPWEGTDRQARGRIMAALRAAPTGIPLGAARSLIQDSDQANRAITGLIADGLAQHTGSHLHLPT
jgi:A/G-specific adenine glycosylase